MIRDVRLKWLLAIAMLALPMAATQAAVSIDMVTVGNTGNTADDTGYGAVDYNYDIGKYEVTAGQYTQFLNAVAATDSHALYHSWMGSDYRGCQIQQSGSSGSYTYSVAIDWADRPVNYVSLWDAARFTNWLHNGQGTGDTESGAYHDIGNLSLFGHNSDARFFIPTQDEWYKAAYHKNNGNTGDYFELPTMNDVGGSPPLSNALDGSGNNATFADSEYTIGSPYYRTEVGAHMNSESPYGTLDQGGNVWEWTEGVISGTSWVSTRGGSYTHHSGYLAAGSGGVASDPAGESHSVGFRVASVPEPASILVWLGLGVIGLIWCRRRS